MAKTTTNRRMYLEPKSQEVLSRIVNTSHHVLLLVVPRTQLQATYFQNNPIYLMAGDQTSTGLYHSLQADLAGTKPQNE